jgi:phosphopantetheine adenylyltransferase
MGGVAGHMDHLYDNRDLTFGEMKDIIRAAANAELSTEEKVDGQNLFISYSVPEGKAKGARNKGNLKAGGLDAVGLAKKFAGRGGLEKAFVNGFDAFEKAVESLSDREKIKAFGPDANIWYNSEIMDPGTEGDPNDPGSVNVIKYDNKTLKIHGVGHFVFDRETGEKKPIPEGTLEVIDNALERMQSHLSNTDSKYKLARKAIINLQKLEDEEVLSRSIALINRQMSDNDLNDRSTMQDYMFTRLLRGMDSELPENTKREIVKYLMKLPGNIGLRALKKGLSSEDLADLNNVIAAKKSLLLQAVEPLENVVHDFTVELLNGLDSVFIADTSKEVMRLKDELSKAVKQITAKGPEDPAAMEVMQRHLNKIKDFSQITTPVEAVVFDYNGHTYKFAGNFAPLNQILGMFKYGSAAPILAKEGIENNISILSEDEGNIKTDRAKKFVLSLPKFTPTESWGKPDSMERKQVEKIFSTLSGGASIEARLQDLKRRASEEVKMTSPRRIISTLIMLESLSAVINSFSSSAAGFVFEGFLAAMLGGKQEAEISAKGNLPIQDLIAFSSLDGAAEVPVSLKLLRQEGGIHGSYTNLIDSLNEFADGMVYIVARKAKDEILLEQFKITRDNVFELLTQGRRAAAQNELFGRGGYGASTTLNKLRRAKTWEEKYEIYRSTNGYNAAQREKDIEKAKSDLESREEQEAAMNAPSAERDAEENQVKEEGKRIITVEENRKMIEQHLLTEAKRGGKQWVISAKQLPKFDTAISNYKELGELPVSPDRIVKIAAQHMDSLSKSVEDIFDATKKLSDNIDNYFTYGDRSQAINAGSEAIKDSETIGREMTQQVSDASSTQTESLDHNKVITEDEDRRIALFPGKFKPPHRGHFDYVNQIAKRSDVDEVIILISPVDFPEVTNEQSLSIWKEYLKNGEPNITAKIADYRSPVQAVYEFVADPVSARDGDTVLLVKSSKDVGDTRFNRAQQYADKHNPGVTVDDIVEDPIQSDGGIVYSARDMRQAINDGDREKFLSYVPESADADALWDTLTKKEESLNSLIDDAIEEMSTVAGGAVGGYPLPLGAKPVYPKGNKRKRNKPKVNRGKRQRRR